MLENVEALFAAAVAERNASVLRADQSGPHYAALRLAHPGRRPPERTPLAAGAAQVRSTILHLPAPRRTDRAAGFAVR